MISIKDMSLSFGVQPIFNSVTFNINAGDKIGLVGRNGSGKTSFFRLLTKECAPDSGQVAIPKNYTIGLVEQHISFSEDLVLLEGCLGLPADERYNEWIVEKLLLGLGFAEEDFYRNPMELSGGYQVRLNLVKVLAAEPNMLLLDEPTNYLDIASVRWLTSFLKSWKNELMIISHDRFFMDSISNHTIAIHRQKMKKLKASSEVIGAKIAEEEINYEKTRLNQEKKDQTTREYINRFRSKATKAKSVQSRIKALERSDQLEKLEDIETIDFKFREAPFPSKTIMQINKLCFTYPKMDFNLIHKFNLTVNKGDKICVIGKNGIGKSTLLKLLAAHLEPNAGSIKKHDSAKIGYFGQTNILSLNQNNTIEEELTLDNPDVIREQIRRVCGIMMFSQDLALKKIEMLSGGEKSRTLLAKILLNPTNFLLLDEPTHHLDMETCEVLISAIESFAGASIIVTHSEAFLHRVAQKIVILDQKGIRVYPGGYQDFLDHNEF